MEAYSNLPNFLREIFPEARDKYKSLIKSMGREPKNWRSRYIFARHICEYIGVFDYNILYIEIWPLALQLCEDMHSIVRKTAAIEVAKLSLYLLSKNSDWKRHIEMSIKKYSKGTVNNRIIFLIIMKYYAGVDLAGDFSNEIATLAKDPIINVRIMCAETVVLSKANVWENGKKILADDIQRDVIYKLGNDFISDNTRNFITPPLLRSSHKEEIGGLIKFSHNLKQKFDKISNYQQYSINH